MKYFVEKNINLKPASAWILNILFLLAIFSLYVVSVVELVTRLTAMESNDSSTGNQFETVTRTTLVFFYDLKLAPPYWRSLVSWNNYIKCNYLGYNQINDIVIGKNGWLYLDSGGSMSDYMGLFPYTEDNLSYLLKTITAQRDLLQKKGIPLLLVIVPNKETIYPEYLPDTIKKIHDFTRQDQLIQYFKAHSDIEILDLRKALRQAKNDYPTYYATDSHWNNFGAFIAYQEIMKRINSYLPGVKPYQLSDFQITVSPVKGQDLAEILLMKDEYSDQRIDLIYKGQQPNTGPGTKLPSAFVFWDSCRLALDQFFSLHFRDFSGVYVGSNNKIDPSVIDQRKPDIVMYIMVERGITGYFFK